MNEELKEKTQRIASTAYGLSYAKALPAMTEIARNHGYCLAVHGSMATDLDLVAVPWVENASDPHVLAEAIKDCIGGMFSGSESAEKNGHLKLHGRIAYNILPSELFLGVPKLPWSPWIDLSIMPKIINDKLKQD